MIFEKDGIEMEISAGGEVTCQDEMLEEFYSERMHTFEQHYYRPYMGNKDGAFWEHTLKEEGFNIISDAD